MNRTIAALLVLASAAAAAAAETPAEARSPGDMSVEERAEMMRSATTYDNCVYERALASIDAHDDIRRIADVAMGECEDRLDSLSAQITGWGFGEEFAGGFTRNVRNRAARKILPELAIRKGN